MHDENNAPAFVLAKKGYDVWLGNFRGSKYSRKQYNQPAEVNPSRFFRFTWTDLGSMDAPEMINYVLRKTNKSNLTLIAHSLGTTPIFANLAKQSYLWKTKLNLFIALAPVTKLDYATSAFI